VDVLVVANLEQEIELLGEERVVILELVTEEREGIDERSAAHHHLRPPLGEKVERGEILEDTHRICRAEHSHGTGQANALRA
jgi:hypothetical protein